MLDHFFETFLGGCVFMMYFLQLCETVGVLCASTKLLRVICHTIAVEAAFTINLDSCQEM